MAKQKDRARSDSRPGTYSRILAGVDDMKIDDVIDTALQERGVDPYDNKINRVYDTSEVSVELVTYSTLDSI